MDYSLVMQRRQKARENPMATASTALKESAANLTVKQRAVLNHLRELFRDRTTCPWGLLPPERELAERVGVSRPTLRLVLAEMEKRGQILRGNGARRVAESSPSFFTNGQNTVGVLDNSLSAPTGPDNSAPGWEHHIQNAAKQVIAEAGVHLLFFGRRDWTDEEIDQLAGQGLAGLLVFRPAIAADAARRVVEAMKAAGVPTVIYGFADGFPDTDSVSHDHEQGQYLATRYLIEKCGCRRIVRLWGLWRGAERPAWLVYRDRGYERAMREADLPVADPIALGVAKSHVSRPELFEHVRRLAAGYLVEHIHGPDAPDAVVCASDGYVFPTASACRLLGRVPGRDIHIAGYDNMFRDHPYREFESYLPAVTIDKNNKRLGRALGRMVLDRLEGQTDAPGRHHLEPPQIVIPSDESYPHSVVDDDANAT